MKAFDVFISKSSIDDLIASAIKHHLEEAKIRCWMAPDNIPAGASWPLEIMKGIQGSSVMLLLWTKNSMNSKEVAKELTLCMQENLLILPFRTENIPPSGEWAYHLSNTHWMDAYDGKIEEHIYPLTERLKAILPERDNRNTLSENISFNNNINKNIDGKKEFEESLQKLKQEALTDAEAMWRLGDLLTNESLNSDSNTSEVILWYSRSAKEGSPTGMLRYGEILFSGQGVTKDDYLSANWLRQASVNGVTEAKFIYEERVSASVMGYLIDKAVQGDLEIQKKIISSYEDNASDAVAFNCLKKSYDEGDSGATKILALIFIKIIVLKGKALNKKLGLPVMIKAKNLGLKEAELTLKYYAMSRHLNTLFCYLPVIAASIILLMIDFDLEDVFKHLDVFKKYLLFLALFLYFPLFYASRSALRDTFYSKIIRSSKILEQSVR